MRIVYNTLFALFLCVQLNAQDGLERIIVEKYYVSTESDKAVDGDGGELPVGSVTYRVYVDMLPGYIFQAAFGVPEHEIRIATTTRFFNNEDRGSRHPTYTRNQAQNNTVMLDSWLSVGGGMKDYAGVLKANDDGVNTIVNADGVLQNADTDAGIPLTQQDGVVLAATEPVTVVGFFDTDLTIFDDANDAAMPAIMSSRDGAWSALNGAMGPDSTENIVLIGQFTTDGEFEFELNIQIRNQGTLGVETYVARDPLENQIQRSDLIYPDTTSAVRDNRIILQDQVKVFPNPTTGHITVQIDDQIPVVGANNSYRLIALDGSTLSSGKITDHMSALDFNNLMPGIYILSLELGNKYQYKGKIVVTR